MLPGAPRDPARRSPPDAPQNPLATRRAEVTRILDESLARGRAYDLLVSLCAAAPHRLAGSPGAARAVEWARERMVEIGLENVRLEPCTVPCWERGSLARLAFTAPARLAGEELAVLALGGSVATPPEGLEAEVVLLQRFEGLRALGGGAAGRIVLFDRPLDETQRDPFAGYGGAVDQRARGAVEAARAGGVAALVRSITTRHDDVPHTGAMGYEDGVPRVPAAAVGTRSADRLAALLAAGETVRVRLQLDCAWRDPAPSFNVVGELRGAERPEEIVLLGAHLDAWDVGQGAHDDGAGCVHSLEAVRLLRALGLRPRRTIRVVLFMNEENGLAGGRAYARDHAGEADRHVAALESDRGGFLPRGFTTSAGEAGLAALREAAALLAETGAEKVVPGGGGADIGPLGRLGVPLIGFLPDGQRYFDVHHSAHDTIESVSRRELHLGAAAIAALAWLLADSPAALPRE
ncbi:MAG: M20/M25/M40 family metallo-hydrolase [Planctomycetota bacterium]